MPCIRWTALKSVMSLAGTLYEVPLQSLLNLVAEKILCKNLTASLLRSKMTKLAQFRPLVCSMSSPASGLEAIFGFETSLDKKCLLFKGCLDRFI